MLDLALLDRTREGSDWERAVSRARWVAKRLAPDPEHGALIYHPGRLDPRNCSNSVIDSGECTDALGRLLLHPRAANLDTETRDRLTHAVERNAETYLRTAVVDKGITNQRLWGAMGLASAHALLPRASWRDALAQSLDLAISEQRDDGSWGYQPSATAEGAHPGAADLTIYYHSRCLAFMLHIVEHLPALDGERMRAAIRNGVDFLALVTLPDGLKPLALEGKRWFWEGSYEAGSGAYDVYALLRGAELLGRDDLRDLATRAWRQVARHQRTDGAIEACRERGIADFVCPDFHTADLAWTAQVMSELPDPRGSINRLQVVAGVREAGESGVIRLDGSVRSVVIRTHKRPANTQFGGSVGGAGMVAVVDSDGAGLLDPGEGVCTIHRRRSLRAAISGVRRFLRENPLRREGRQWLFVARLLIRQRRPGAAWRRIWRGFVGPLIRSVDDDTSPDWAIESETSTGVAALTARAGVARTDGKVPAWAAGLAATRQFVAKSDGLSVRLTVSGDAREVSRISYVLPAAARYVEVNSDGLDVRRGGATVTARPTRASLRFGVTYVL